MKTCRAIFRVRCRILKLHVPREIEQNVATTGGPRWERGHSGYFGGAMKTYRVIGQNQPPEQTPLPSRHQLLGPGVRFAVLAKSPKADVAPSARAQVVRGGGRWSSGLPSAATTRCQRKSRDRSGHGRLRRYDRGHAQETMDTRTTRCQRNCRDRSGHGRLGVRPSRPHQ